MNRKQSWVVTAPQCLCAVFKELFYTRLPVSLSHLHWLPATPLPLLPAPSLLVMATQGTSCSPLAGSWPGLSAPMNRVPQGHGWSCGHLPSPRCTLLARRQARGVCRVAVIACGLRC